MWRLFKLALLSIDLALGSDFDFVRDKCTCDYANTGPHFLPNDTVWDKNDDKATMPFQCPRKKLRNKYAVMKFLVNVEEEINRSCNMADNCRRLGRRRNHDKLVAIPKFDYIVVGSGAAGAVIAGRLASQLHRTVLLLEAGDVDPVLSRVPAFYKYFRYHNDTDWNFRTEYDKDYCKMSYGRCRLNHGRTLGGTTVINDMIYQRGHKYDCNEWFRFMGRKFKTCRDFEPYYIKFENNLDRRHEDYNNPHGDDGPMPVQKFRHRPKLINRFIDGAIDVGFRHLVDMINPHYLSGGLGVADSFQASNGQRYTTARTYLGTNLENLLVVLGTQVTKVLFKGNRAYGVEYVFNKQWSDRRVVEAEQEIILSAGVFNTPKILMLSGIGPQKELERLNISLLKDYPVGSAVKFHYGFRMRYALGYGADHMRRVNWIDLGWLWSIWYYLWENAMVYLKANDKLSEYYWVDFLDQSSLDKYIDTGEGGLASNGLAQMVGMFTTRHSIDKAKPDIQVIFEGLQSDCSKTRKENLTIPFKYYFPTKFGDRVYNGTKFRIINNTIPYWTSSHKGKSMRVSADLDVPASRNIDVFIHLLDPRSTGRMTLSSTNPADPPLIYPHFFEHRDDALILLEGAKIVDKIMLADAIEDLKLEMPVDYFRICGFSEYYYRYNIGNSYYTPEGYYFNIFNRNINITFVSCLMRQYTVARYHQQGTVPLGEVLNEYYQVKDFTGLRVVDGSILSGPISGSPQGTIMMFGEHLSEMLVKEAQAPNYNSINLNISQQT